MNQIYFKYFLFQSSMINFTCKQQTHLIEIIDEYLYSTYGIWHALYWYVFKTWYYSNIQLIQRFFFRHKNSKVLKLFLKHKRKTKTTNCINVSLFGKKFHQYLHSKFQHCALINRWQGEIKIPIGLNLP